MANKTVYPFGTNGSLPAGVGIINDLTTGGADKALSAEMGKKIGEDLREISHAETYDTPVDVYALPQYDYLMIAAGEYAPEYAYWVSQDGSTGHKAKTALIPLAGVDVVRFSISGNTRIAMLRSNNMGNNVAIDLASGWDDIMKPQAGDYTFVVPDDATLLAIATAGISGTDARYIYDITLQTNAKGGIMYVDDMVFRGLDFPVMGYGNKMLSKPISTYTHTPKIVETAKYIFVLYASSKETTVESVGDKNDTVLCVISKATGEQWYETIFDCKNPETVDGNTCLYNHNSNMINVSETEVVVTVGCVNDGKFLFINKTYNASTRAIGPVEKSTLSYGGNAYDLNLRNYIQMANSVYSLSITESDKVANSADIWNPSVYDDNGVTKYIALFSFKVSSADATPYIMMTSTDARAWSPLFLLQTDLKSGETSAIVANGKIYLTNRIGGSFSDDQAHGQFYGVCNMSGTMLKAWEKINVQRTRPCEVAIDGTVYIIYNDGNNSGKYWGRTKIVIAKVNADYSLTEIKSFTSPYGIHYQSACDHNGAMLIAYAEDVRGYNAGTNNAITDIAIAQFYDFNS